MNQRKTVAEYQFSAVRMLVSAEGVTTLAKEAPHGIRKDILRKEVTIDGKRYLEIIYEIDYGSKNGVTKVRVLDPCITEEAQQKRREAIVRKCQELIKRGLM